MIVIGRHINGITINPLEYLLNDDGTIKEFENKAKAVEFLRENGFTDEDLDYMVFEEN